MCIKYVDLLLVGNVQGLGLLNIELTKDFPKLNLNSKLKSDQLKKLRHITLSELWIMGTYEILRLTKDILVKNTNFSDQSKNKVREILSNFTEIRIPLVKFQKMGKNNRLYSGVTTPTFDSVKGLGWSIHTSNKEGVRTKIVYRSDLANEFLQLLKTLQEDLRAKSISKQN